MDLNLNNSILSDPKPFRRIILLYAVGLALSMCGGLPVHAQGATKSTPVSASMSLLAPELIAERRS
jgi:hypothetical protein